MMSEPENSLSLRKINCRLGVLSRPDGSVLFTQGDTVILAGVYGPVEVKTQKMLINKASVEAFYQPKIGMPGIGDRLYESIIQNTCETSLLSTLYPRSSIVIVIQEMQDGGGIISCAVNACCFALLNSGIDMKFLVASATCALDENGVFHLDPDKLIINKSKATFVFVFDNVAKRIIASHTSGSFNLAQYGEALELCKNACQSDLNLAIVQGLRASANYVFRYGAQVHTPCHATPKRRLQVQSRRNETENSGVYSKQSQKATSRMLGLTALAAKTDWTGLIGPECTCINNSLRTVSLTKALASHSNQMVEFQVAGRRGARKHLLPKALTATEQKAAGCLVATADRGLESGVGSFISHNLVEACLVNGLPANDYWANEGANSSCHSIS
ncbi:hypothetical protein FQA39_LY06936 [Lamprigera yunnana]|nr:hypothetical protein FQA39_LY06936 [Lamprigera yunnana]